MDQAKAIRKGEALDWKNLDDYLRLHMPQLEGDLSVTQFHGGHANLTYLMTFGDKEYVLRRPPFGKIAPGAHDMKREYKVLSKLNKFYTPAPRAYHYCEDVSIIGAPFVILERREGVVIRTKMLDCFAEFENAEERVADAMIKAIADLHLVNYHEAKLDDLGRPEGFLERQLAGWTKRWQLSQTDENGAMADIINWLGQDIPTTQFSSIIHNDIKLDNCQFQPDNPDKVTAVFDWDMCTLGDPLFDFASTLSYWPDHRIDIHKYPNLPVTLEGDFPPKDFLIKKYQAYTGLDMSRLKWYEVFAYWKGAVIAQQLFKRYKDGATKDERMELFDVAAQSMADLALQVLEDS